MKCVTWLVLIRHLILPNVFRNNLECYLKILQEINNRFFIKNVFLCNEFVMKYKKHFMTSVVCSIISFWQYCNMKWAYFSPCYVMEGLHLHWINKLINYENKKKSLKFYVLQLTLNVFCRVNYSLCFFKSNLSVFKQWQKNYYFCFLHSLH